MARLTAEAMMAPGGLLDAGSRLVTTLMEVPFQRAQYEGRQAQAKQAEDTRQQERRGDINRQTTQLQWQQDHAQDVMQLGVLRDQMGMEVQAADAATKKLELARGRQLDGMQAFQSEKYSDRKKYILDSYDAEYAKLTDGIDALTKAPEFLDAKKAEAWSNIAPGAGVPAGVSYGQFVSGPQVAFDLPAIQKTLEGSMDPSLTEAAQRHIKRAGDLATKAREIAGIEMADAAYNNVVSRFGATQGGVGELVPATKAEITPPTETPRDLPSLDAVYKEDEAIQRARAVAALNNPKTHATYSAETARASAAVLDKAVDATKAVFDLPFMRGSGEKFAIFMPELPQTTIANAPEHFQMIKDRLRTEGIKYVSPKDLEGYYKKVVAAEETYWGAVDIARQNGVDIVRSAALSQGMPEEMVDGFLSETTQSGAMDPDFMMNVVAQSQKLRQEYESPTGKELGTLVLEGKPVTVDDAVDAFITKAVAGKLTALQQLAAEKVRLYIAMKKNNLTPDPNAWTPEQQNDPSMWFNPAPGPAQAPGPAALGYDQF